MSVQRKVLWASPHRRKSKDVMINSSPRSSLPKGFDHLVIATPHLVRTLEKFQQSTGVEPALGGDHPLKGTRNYLVGLGQSAYLEIIGRNPEKSPGSHHLPFNIGELVCPAVVTWALRVSNIGAARDAAKAEGFDIGADEELSRRTPSGSELRWRLTPPCQDPNGIIPFLIDWGESSSPASTDIPSVPVSRFSASHPAPGDIEAVLCRLGTDLRLEQGAPGLSMTIETPKGPVVMDGATVGAW